MRSSRPSGLLRRCGQIALLALISLILLETVLQIGAIAVALLAPAPAHAPRQDGRRVVLCVGDSFTYGLGASDQTKTSYPAQLQTRLEQAAPGAWQVVNEGYPGRNSRQMLERLEQQLDEYRPDFVCILVGLNDRWSHPEPLDLSEETGAVRGTYRFELRTLRLWRLLWSKLRGSSSSTAVHSQFTPRLTAADPWLRIDAHDAPSPEAERAHRDALADPQSGAALDKAFAEAGPQEKTILLDGMQKRVEALKSPVGSDLPLLRTVAHECRAAAPTTALRAALLAFLLTGDRTRFAGEITAGAAKDPAHLDALEKSLNLPRAERDAANMVFADALGWRQADGIWVQPSTGQQRALVEIRWQDVGPEALRDFEVHRQHLLSAFALCRAKGAVPLLLGYPNRTSFPDEFLIDLATRGQVEFLSTVKAIEERLAAEPSAQLFVADGHCNDAGYRLMAEVVCRRLLGR